MNTTTTTTTELEQARAWVDAAVEGRYLSTTTGVMQKWAFACLVDSPDPADLDRALAIRAEWNAEWDRWAGWEEVGRLALRR